MLGDKSVSAILELFTLCALDTFAALGIAAQLMLLLLEANSGRRRPSPSISISGSYSPSTTANFSSVMELPFAVSRVAHSVPSAFNFHFAFV